jgi:integrase
MDTAKGSMIFQLGAAVSVKVQYLRLRKGIFQFHLRVPQNLLDHYGKDSIRKSLGTSDIKEATRKAEDETRRYQTEFRLLSEGKPITPQDVATAGRLLAEQYDNNFEQFLDHVIGPAREKFAEGDEEVYQEAHPSEYLQPAQLQAWQILANPNAFKLSDALKLYFKTHQRGTEQSFITKTSRDWDALISLVGDTHFDKLNRSHARDFVDHLTAKGNKTGTIRRTLNTLGAIVRTTITELELSKTDPFKSIKIQGEGKDTEQAKVASSDQLQDIAKTLLSNTSSAVALMTLIQMELGSRIGEVSGLGVDDVFLDNEVPHVYFRDRPWRTLKTKESERRVPVVGIALIALKAALILPRTGQGLFEAYAKPRGNDAASAAVNKRLSKWSLTSHSFRHAMKDRLREAGCPKDIRDAIQGHSSGDVADTYGQGHTLRTMHKWLKQVAVTLYRV